MCCQRGWAAGLVLTFQEARAAGFFSRRRCMRWVKCSEAPAASEAARNPSSEDPTLTHPLVAVKSSSL